MSESASGGGFDFLVKTAATCLLIPSAKVLGCFKTGVGFDDGGLGGGKIARKAQKYRKSLAGILTCRLRLLAEVIHNFMFWPLV
jgi:hypothetical protein